MRHLCQRLSRNEYPLRTIGVETLSEICQFADDVDDVSIESEICNAMIKTGYSLYQLFLRLNRFGNIRKRFAVRQNLLEEWNHRQRLLIGGQIWMCLSVQIGQLVNTLIMLFPFYHTTKNLVIEIYAILCQYGVIETDGKHILNQDSLQERCHFCGCLLNDFRAKCL